MSDTQHSVWTDPPAPEEREYYAELLRQRDEAQRRNDSVPTFERPNSMATDKVMTGSAKVDVDVPAPTAPVFYAKHSITPRSGSSVGPDDRVALNIPGYGQFETSVAAALNMGLITANAGGGYRGLDAGERNDKAAAEQQRAQEEQQRGRAELAERRAVGDAPDADTTNLMEALARTIPSNAVQQLSYDLAINGTMSESGIARVAEASGLTHEQGKRVASEMFEGLSRQALAAVVSEKVPAEMAQEVYDWAAQHSPVEYRHAVMNMAIAADATALKQLARKFYLHKVVRQST